MIGSSMYILISDRILLRMILWEWEDAHTHSKNGEDMLSFPLTCKTWKINEAQRVDVYSSSCFIVQRDMQLVVH